MNDCVIFVVGVILSLGLSTVSALCFFAPDVSSWFRIDLSTFPFVSMLPKIKPGIYGEVFFLFRVEMKLRGVLAGNIIAARDVSPPERGLGDGSPPPLRRGGLRSGNNTPYSSAEGRTGFGNSSYREATAPGSEEHLHKRGQRGSVADEKDTGIELSVVLSGDVSSIGTDTGTRHRRHPRRLSFDKELGSNKPVQADGRGNQVQVPGVTVRSKRKDTASPRKEPEPKLSRGVQEEGIASNNRRSTRKRNTVAEPGTAPAGENWTKKSSEKDVIKARAGKSTEKLERDHSIEETMEVDRGATLERQLGNLGKRPRGRPKRSMAASVEQNISSISEIKPAENVPKKRGRKKSQGNRSNPKPSDDPLVLLSAEIMENTVSSFPLETVEKCVKAQVAEPSKAQFRGDLQDNVLAIAELTSPATNMSPRKALGRPKKLPVVSLKGKKSRDVSRDPSVTEIGIHVDETKATTNVKAESVENPGKKPRGRPKKLQNSLTQECDVTAPTTTATNATVENLPTTDNLTGNSLKTQASAPLKKMFVTIDTANSSMQTLASASPSSKAEEAVVVDPCPSFLKDTKEAYPDENPSIAQPRAAINDAEKGSACLTPDPSEKTSKRSRARRKKGQTAQAELKFGVECANENAKSEFGVQIKKLSGALDNGPSDELSKFSVMSGLSPEIATRDSVWPFDPVQSPSPHQNPESDVKGEDQANDSFLSSPVGTNEGKMKRRAGRPTTTRGKKVKGLEHRSAKQERENAGRKPGVRPRRVLFGRNQDVLVNTQETSKKLRRKVSKDEERELRSRPNLRSRDVGHGSGSQERLEKACWKRGLPSKGTKPQNSLEGKRKETVGRRRPGAGQTRSSAKGKNDTSARETSGRRYVSGVVLDGMEFRVGDDVYVRKDGFACSESEAEAEECQVCGRADERTMIECDRCLDGFHLTCLHPPLEEIPEDDWVCPFCTSGSKPPLKLENKGGKRHSAREMLLAAELWAARIDKIWTEQDGSYWFKARWYLIPEETSTGRQKHTGGRELFRSSQSDVNEMDSIVRHCYVMSPDEYKKSSHEGDDVFYCEYDYNERWSRFKRIDSDNHSLANEGSGDEAYSPSDESGPELDHEEERIRQPKFGKKLKQEKSPKAANKRQSFSGGLERVGAKIVADRPRKGPHSDFEKAKAALTLSAVPPSMPCRDLERVEIAAFLKDSVGAGDQCLGHCLYISGVPGTGKTATVREVIKNLEGKVDVGELPAFRFVEINGLRLPSPDHIYTVLHEAFTGQHLGWKRALECLDDRFSSSKPLKGSDARPCVLLIDELDVLVNCNQSVLYNIFDWPSRPHSRLVVIGIANTMDLPERMLPRIASRMGMKRISFSPYSHQQLEEIIASRLEGVRIFDKQAAEFASRKVAAVSGDIRRALELCRRAVEVAEARIAEYKLPSSPENTEDPAKQVLEVTQATPRLVTMADVDAAISQLFEAPQIQMMQRSSKLAKIFLTAMVCEQRRTSMVETTFEKVAATCSELCANNGEDIPDSDTLLGIGCKLGALRILLCEPAARHKLQKLQLNFPCDDVSFALKKDSGVPWLAKFL